MWSLEQKHSLTTSSLIGLWLWSNGFGTTAAIGEAT